MADARTLRIEFKGEGSEQLTAQYQAVITKQKELEKELQSQDQQTGKTAESFDELSESLSGMAKSSGIAEAAGKGLALGLGALGGALANLAIEGVTWAIDKWTESSRTATEEAAKFRSASIEMAEALIQVGQASDGTYNKLNQYGLLLAKIRADQVGQATQGVVADTLLATRGPVGRYGARGRLDPGVAEVEAVLRDYQTAAPSAESVKSTIDALEQLVLKHNELKKTVHPVILALGDQLKAIEASVPATVQLSDVVDGLTAKQTRAAEIVAMSADKAAVATAYDNAYRDAKEQLVKSTDASAASVEAAARKIADMAAATKQAEIDERNHTKALSEGTKELKARAAAQEAAAAAADKARSAMLRQESDERLLAERMTNDAMKPIYKDLEQKDRSAKEQQEAARKAAEAAAKEVTDIWDRAREDFADGWRGLFVDVFDGGKFRFKDFTDSMRSMWANLLADLLTMSLQKSFIDPLFDGLTGGLSGAGASRTRSAFAQVFDGPDDSVSKSFGGLGDIGGDLKKSLFDPIKKGLDGIFGDGFSKNVGGMLGGAAMGAGVGGLVGSGTGGAIGGALGQMFGPLGGLVGGLLGGLVGSLFKSTPRSISSITTTGTLAGIGDSYASGLDIKIGQNAAKTVANALNEFAREIDLSLDSDAFVGMIGQRGKKFFFQAQQSDIKKAGKKRYGAETFDDAESAIAAAIEAALEAGIIDGLTDVDMKLQRAASDVKEGMQKVIGRKEFMKELDFQYMGITDPLGAQLARLEDWYKEQLKLAEEYEVDKTKLDALYADKRKDLIESYNEQLYGGLKDFLTSITAGSASTLAPTTRLALSQSNYDALVSKARAGDRDAIAALQGAAGDYLSAGRDVFASSSGYQSIYERVVADLSSITGMKNPLTGAGGQAQAIATAMNDNSRVTLQVANQAAAQRNTTNERLGNIETLLSGIFARTGAAPTQNGVVQVGWPNIAVNW